MQVKKIKSFFDLFINKIFEFTFVTFKSEQTILNPDVLSNLNDLVGHVVFMLFVATKPFLEII